jgi:hypothetical protein
MKTTHNQMTAEHQKQQEIISKQSFELATNRYVNRISEFILEPSPRCFLLDECTPAIFVLNNPKRSVLHSY